MVRGYSLT